METTTNPADAISQILNARAQQIFADFTTVLEERGIDFARGSAFGWLRSHDAGRAVSRSTCQIANLVTDVERAATFQFIEAMEDGIGFAENKDDVSEIVDFVRKCRYNRLG